MVLATNIAAGQADHAGIHNAERIEINRVAALADAGRPLTEPLIRTNSTLTRGGKPVKLVGINAFDLILNDAGGVHRPDKSFVAGKLGFVKSQGWNWVRCTTLGANIRIDPDSAPNYYQQALIIALAGDKTPVYNNETWALIDYTIAKAEKLGIYLQIPLCDIWKHYHGGIGDWIRLGYLAGYTTDMPTDTTRSKTVWNDSATKTAQSQFYTNAGMIAMFKSYIATYLDRTNTVDGKRQGDHFNLIFELGNELGDTNSGNLAAGPTWVNDIASYIKTKTNSMVADGYMNQGGPVSQAPGLASSSVDIVGTHYYNSTWDTTSLNADLAAAVGANKAFMIGEFGWSRYTNGQDMLDWVEASPNVLGAAAWALIDPIDQHSEANNLGVDDVPLHYPAGAVHTSGAGNTPARKAAQQKFFYQMYQHRKNMIG